MNETERPNRPRPNLGCLHGILYSIFIIGLSAILASVGWALSRDVFGFMKAEGYATVVVPKDFTVASVADTLYENGFIEYKWLFKLFCNITKRGERISPGTYELRLNLDYNALTKQMRSASQELETIRLTIPEGYTVRQIVEMFADKKVAELSELWDTATNYDFEYDFLEGLPAVPNRLEGFLFPDTYDFYIGENPVTALNKLLANFDRKFGTEMRERTEELDMTVNELITVASIVEREATNDTYDRENVAAVIYNRLGSTKYPNLEIDATTLYALPEHKEWLTAEDLKYDSPYNTHLYAGLPPGPIANPGLNAIRAALYCEESPYYFYALTEEGVHKFSKTLDEHNKVIRDNPGIYGGR